LNLAVEVNSQNYWKNPFTSLCSTWDLIEFMVLDIEPIGPTKGKYVLANVQVARSSDLGTNDTTFFTRTHLGHMLEVGDLVLGYDITRANFNHDDFEKLDTKELPDVILVKKSYEEKRKHAKSRQWYLKRMEEGSETFGFEKKKDQLRAEEDFEEFLRELEEDPEFRANVNIYKVNGPVEEGKEDATKGEKEESAANENEEDNDLPVIPVEEMIDENKIKQYYEQQEEEEDEDDDEDNDYLFESTQNKDPNNNENTQKNNE